MRRNIATKGRKKRNPKSLKAAIAAIDWESKANRSRRDGWLKREFKLKRPPSHVLAEDDWSLVIKIHGYVETAMNQLLYAYFNEPKANKIIFGMDMGHKGRGKLGLIKALGLLPQEAWSFVKLLSDLRNTFAHDIKWLDVKLKKHLTIKDHKEAWKRALQWWRTDHAKGFSDSVFLFPRNALVDAAIAVMAATASQKSGADLRHLRKDVLALTGKLAEARSEQRKRAKSKAKKSIKRHQPKVRQK